MTQQILTDFAILKVRSILKLLEKLLMNFKVETSGETLQFMLLLTNLQEKFTNQLGGQNPQSMLDLI